MVKFSIELHSLLVRFIHDVPVFLELIDLDLVLTQLFSADLLNFLDLILELVNYFVVVLLIDLLELRDFILQSNRSLQLLIIFLLQTTLYIRLVNLLFSKSIMQLSDCVLPKIE